MADCIKQECYGNVQPKPTRPVASCDQEAWVKQRIRTAIEMANSLRQERRVGADEPAYRYALEGLVEGTAVEIIHTLGMEPEFVNLRNLL